SSRVSAECRQKILPSFAVARSFPRTGCNRQIQCPGWFTRHETDEFFDAAEADRHFADELVVDMQHDGIAGAFDTQHHRSEQITRDARNDVFSPQTAVGTLTKTAVNKLPTGIVSEHDTAFIVLVLDDAWPRVSKLAAGRQLEQ